MDSFLRFFIGVIGYPVLLKDEKLRAYGDTISYRCTNDIGYGDSL